MRRTGVPLAVLCCALVAGGCASSSARDSAVDPTSRPTGQATSGPVSAAGLPTTVPSAEPTASTGAGSPTPVPPTSAPATGTPAPGDTVAAYRYLVRDVNGFIAAAIEAEEQNPDVAPDDPAEILDLVGYDFADGVELATWEDSGICFTGPGDTWWSFGEARRDFLRLSLGTGECAGPAPDVVVDIEPAASLTRLRTRVLTGADVAAQLPELDDFVGLMNEQMQ